MKLKTCPFCGGDTRDKFHPIHKEEKLVECIECGVNYMSPDCVDDWNTRSPYPLLTKALEALREIKAEIDKWKPFLDGYETAPPIGMKEIEEIVDIILTKADKEASNENNSR